MPQNRVWTYEFPLPACDLRSHPQVLRPPFNVLLQGVDGRWTGGLRRFPGFKRVRRLSTALPATSECFSFAFSSAFRTGSTLRFFKYAEIQKGNTPFLLRGFVTQKGGSVYFSYYDTESSTWTEEFLFYAAGQIDASYGGKFLYIAQANDQGRTVFHNGTSLIVLPMGHLGTPKALYVSPNGGLAVGSLSGDIEYEQDGLDHSITVGYRFGDSRRNVWTPLVTATLSFTAIGGGGTSRVAVGFQGATQPSLLRIPVPSEALDQYDTIEVYRTILDGGVLYREIYYHIPTRENKPGATLGDMTGEDRGKTTPLRQHLLSRQISVCMGLQDGHYIRRESDATALYAVHGHLNDNELVFQPSYNFETEEAGAPPFPDRIFTAGGFNVISVSHRHTEGSIGEVYWSSLYNYRPEIFSSLNVYRPPRVSDRIQRFIGSADSIWGIADNRLFRFTRVGTAMQIEKVLHGWGLVNYGAAAELSGDLAILGPSTLVMVSGASGSPTTVSLIERKLQSWADKSRCHLVYDSRMACLFITNPDAEEAICLWGTTNTATVLGDMNYVLSTSGPHPEQGGQDRAFFMTANGLIVYPDADREDTMHTQHGVLALAAADLEITDAVENYTTNKITLSTTVTDCRDAYVYIWRKPDGPWVRRKVVINVGSDLYLDSPVTISEGDRVELSPVPFKVIAAPLSVEDGPPSVLNAFQRKIVHAMGVSLHRITGGAATLPMTLGIIKSSGETPTVSASVPNIGTDFAKLRIAGGVLFPVVECFASDLDFELLSLAITGTLEDTKKD